jgi:hypothetical protein
VKRPYIINCRWRLIMIGMLSAAVNSQVGGRCPSRLAFGPPRLELGIDVTIRQSK